MRDKCKPHLWATVLSIIFWGALWGVFESTVGYFLHSISFGYSWLIWYPFACFFMTNAYQKSQRVSSIFWVGLLCSSVKMLNLLLPGRFDKVINPAISILFESLAMTAVVFAFRLFQKNGKSLFVKALAALAMNTGWRILFILYLLFLVPDWIRNISVISSPDKFIPFFITQNLMTSVLIFLGYQFKEALLKPIEIIEKRISNWFSPFPNRTVSILKAALATLMLCANVSLQFLLN